MTTKVLDRPCKTGIASPPMTDWAADTEKAYRTLRRRFEKLDPTDQIMEAEHMQRALLEEQNRVASIRRAAVRSLRANGWTLREIAEATGLTYQRVAQIETGKPRA